MGKIVIFAGGFGSGKSEIALNYALTRKSADTDVILADLDLVNPYFASRDVRNYLESKSIRVVAPSGALSFGDVPAVPGEIIGLLGLDNEFVIDLAGDEVGSLVAGYLSRYVKARPYEFLMVINPYRPFAQDLDSIKEMVHMLEGAAHLKFTGIVSNPNLLGETTAAIIRQGHARVLEYAQAVNIPVAFLTVTNQFYQELNSEYGELMHIIDLYLRPDWL